jgi:hypothetical protein
MDTAATIPYIDPNVEHVGVSRLRSLNAEVLRNFQKTLVIQENDQPLAVLLTYSQFIEMQQQLNSVLSTIEILTDDDERAALTRGVAAISQGKVKSLSDIRAELKKKGR